MSDAGGEKGEPRQEPESSAESTGYKRPPKAHQFQKGVSGNPNGRPKKKPKRRTTLPNAVRIAERILSESRRPVSVRENGEVEDIPTIDAVLRSLSLGALKGSARAQVAYANLVKRAEETLIDEWNAIVQDVGDYRQRWREVFEHCDARGAKRPEPVPHPDEIVLDHALRDVRYNGPADEAQKAQWDKQYAKASSALKEIAEIDREIRAELRRPPEAREPGLVAILMDDLVFCHLTIALTEGLFPSPEIRRAPSFDLGAHRRGSGMEHAYSREGRTRLMADLRSNLAMEYERKDPWSIA